MGFVHQQLLDLPMKKLPLEDVESRLKRYKFLLQKELRSKGLAFDFHLWISDEWFCPDGVPGFALPFYLFNKKLMKIQKKQTGLVEGVSEFQILKLMRHELGHTIDNAYALRTNKQRQEYFGSSKQAYPTSYAPNPYSKNFVHYLGDNYAQSHPDEDFAETFAYWLDPSKQWRLKKLSPVVQKKLEFMDELMNSLVGVKAKLKNKFKVEPIEKNSKSLKEHYNLLNQQRDGVALKRVDHHLRSAFPEQKSSRTLISFSQFEKRKRKTLCREVAQKTGFHQYEVQWALKTLSQRAQSLGICATQRELLAKTPSLIEKNYRYLKENNLLKFYL